MIISNFIAYAKQAWKNKPDTSTPLSAARLTHLEDGVKGNSDAIEKIAAAVVSQIVNDPNKIASMAALYSVNEKVDSAISDLGNKAGLISFSYAGGNTETDIINALYQNWSKFPVGSSVIKFNNNVEVWTGIVNKYDAAKGSALIQAAGTGFIKKYIHNGTQLYSLIATDEIKFDGVGKVVFAQNSTATSIRFYTTAVNYLYIEFLTATKNIKFGFYNGSTWTDYWIM